MLPILSIYDLHGSTLPSEKEVQQIKGYVPLRNKTLFASPLKTSTTSKVFVFAKRPLVVQKCLCDEHALSGHS